MECSLFIDALKSRGYQENDRIFFGLERFFPVCVELPERNDRLGCAVCVTIGEAIIEPSAKRALKADLLHYCESAKVKSDMQGDGCVLMRVDEADINTVLNLPVICDLLASYGINAPKFCPICNKSDTDSYFVYGNKFCTGHRQCMNDEVIRQEGKAGRGIRRFFISAVDVIVGAAVGLFPAFLFFCFQSEIPMPVYLLIPLGAFLGYRLLRNRKINAVISLILCILIFALLEFFPSLLFTGSFRSSFVSDARLISLIMNLITSVRDDAVKKDIAARKWLATVQSTLICVNDNAG